MNTKMSYVGRTYRWEGNIVVDFGETVFGEDLIELTWDGIYRSLPPITALKIFNPSFILTVCVSKICLKLSFPSCFYFPHH